ncbi:MAG TPA: ATP synthase F1 subunit gamma [bacterium]|jgi:F-type H+-transporting ATPase subunit gamma|nr:ATP synthase F1 subunit gamma [bacterium]
MAQIREIKTRIKSVKNIGQITKAMKMVATARLKRAQQRVLGARPYAMRMADVMKNLASKAGEEVHPLLSVRNEGKSALVVITADRGLCGSFNTNILRQAQAYLKQNPDTVLLTVGKKGRDFFKRRHFAIRREWLGVFPRVPMETVLEMRDEIEAMFVTEKFKSVGVLYTEFRSVLQQKAELDILLPIRVKELPGEGKKLDYQAGDYEFEPDIETIMEKLISQYLATQLHRFLLESFSSEMASKRNAMESASKNASEMISKLTLEFNRARQAMITKELAEIVGGAAALQ